MVAASRDERSTCTRGHGLLPGLCMHGRRLAVCLALAQAFAAGAPVIAAGTPERLIRYAQNGLTVRLTRAPVLIEIARQADVSRFVRWASGIRPWPMPLPR